MWATVIWGFHFFIPKKLSKRPEVSQPVEKEAFPKNVGTDFLDGLLLVPRVVEVFPVASNPAANISSAVVLSRVTKAD